MKLTTDAAHAYLSTSEIAFASGVLSWDQYVVRLHFIRESVDADTLPHEIANEALSPEEFIGEDDWPFGEPEQSDDSKASTLSVRVGRSPLDPPRIQFMASPNTGLSGWSFHQADRDFFPSIPHGHWFEKSIKKKLDAYRGWVYWKDQQIDREPRWKIISLWNDEKFRSFATTAIEWYLVEYPRFRWRVRHPRRLPPRRKA